MDPSEHVRIYLKRFTNQTNTIQTGNLYTFYSFFNICNFFFTLQWSVYLVDTLKSVFAKPEIYKN
jgi:hypothetical protein